jgi:hypothetical protein
MVIEQKGVCAICKMPNAWNRREGEILVIDHNHATGRIRGLLCHGCNQALGLFRDNILVLEAAIKYLKQDEQSDQSS